MSFYVIRKPILIKSIVYTRQSLGEIMVYSLVATLVYFPGLYRVFESQMIYF
jgi:hypothetical protein